MGRLVLALSVLGCASQPPVSRAESYARALEADQLDRAYALTTPAFQAQLSAEQFRARLADSAARQARAAAVRDGLAELAQAAPELFGTDASERPQAVILRFVTAVRSGQFDDAWRCLSVGLRARYTPDSLARDFRTEPSAGARLEGAVVAAEGIAVKEGDTVRFPLPEGGAVVVLREKEGWRLAALE
jgi:hypothetical protein